MTEHVLKTAACMFDAVELGSKNFQVRKDDRAYQTGDVLTLVRLAEKPEGLMIFTRQDAMDPRAENAHKTIASDCARRISLRVSFILRGGQYGIEPGHVVMGLEAIPGVTHAVPGSRWGLAVKVMEGLPSAGLDWDPCGKRGISGAVLEALKTYDPV